MLLRKVVLRGYRSIANNVELPFDNRVTALLGSNDHGKSNLLAALCHLNSDCPFTPEDLNWNLDPTMAGELPQIQFTFELTQDQKLAIVGTIVAALEKQYEKDVSDLTNQCQLQKAALETASQLTRSKSLELTETRSQLGKLRPQAAKLNNLATSLKNLILKTPEGDKKVKLQAELQKLQDESMLISDQVDSLNEQEAKRDLEAANEKSKAAAKAFDAQTTLLSKVQQEKQQRLTPPTSIQIYLQESNITFVRSGINKDLGEPDIPTDVVQRTAIIKYVRGLLPRVELFEPPESTLPDSANADEIRTDDFEFMQGIMILSGLNPIKDPKIFLQDPSTVRALNKATEQLNRELAQHWSQGKELGLKFKLQHNTSNRIELYVDDPTVTRREVQLSKRSTGVTNFFRLSMSLRARRAKHKSQKHIYLFDEPGIHLHPRGQRDLLQVFEKLSDDSQILYATHSIFLLNQNFPERHRLIFKDKSGTKVEAKGAQANWRFATSAMGVTLPPFRIFL
jgi:predicted ATP-dependent endonuclease of OLD family